MAGAMTATCWQHEIEGDQCTQEEANIAKYYVPETVAYALPLATA